MLRHYSFTRPLTSEGKPTRYISVLLLLDKSGPTHRHEILKAVWNVTNKSYHNLYRGYMSSLFAAMRQSGIVEYNQKTYRWSITKKGRDTLENAKREWGKRYAEAYWN